MLKLALFKAKKFGEKSPDYQNKFTLNETITLEAGQEYDLAAWNTTSKSGLEYISATIKPSERKEEGEEAY
jgi:hypothetical protein